ncbi:hypothetical protein EVAR_98752_1 [Eumeta japonica]|uniref:Uncharacterized protein n=1 Tax=Eumeta variegata TaxID=151549 RepID=A0A4C1YXG8_EUMVA|nr:hypothetical protein EVAR_98752_1 [Eumeta japonica]
MDEKEKGRRRNSWFKVASKLMATIFGIVKAREAVVQKRRGKLSRSAFYKTMHLSIGAGFEAGPEGHGLRKLTTHPTAQI